VTTGQEINLGIKIWVGQKKEFNNIIKVSKPLGLKEEL
jgi:hypothetical protein